MAPPLLNADVLTVACEFLTDVSDVLALALTSSSLHPVALRWLIRMRPVYLNSGPSIRRFHLFLFADEPTRAPHIRALHIDLRRQPTQAQNQDEDFFLLVQILASCKYLEHLTIAFQQITLPIIAEPSFLHTVNAISSLQSFSLRSESNDGISLLPSIRAPLRRICIHTDRMSSSHRYPANLKEFLPHAAVSTLETLELDCFAVEPRDPEVIGHQSIPSTFTIAPYAAVRSLSVYSFMGRPLLDHLQHLFPALEGALDIGFLGFWGPIYNFDGIRATNQHAQDGGGGRGWKKLERVICDAPVFYILALRCPIRLAMIRCYPAENHDFAGVALRENPVPRLTLTLFHESGMFTGLFSPELAGRLTHLTLCLLYFKNYADSPPGGGQLQWDDLLAALVTAIQPLHKLTHLRVVIGATVYVQKEAPWPFPPGGEYAHSFRSSRFDFDGTAAALARILPSLRYIFLTTGGLIASSIVEERDLVEEGRWKLYERWYVSHGWRVETRMPEGSVDGAQREIPGLVELHEDVAETIIRREELVLSKRDEGALHLNRGWHMPQVPLSL